jgi:hypothetical protein
MDVLVERIRAAARGSMREMRLVAAMGDGKSINYLENRSEVLDRQYDGDEVTFTVRIGQRQLDQLQAMGANLRVVDGASK